MRGWLAAVALVLLVPGCLQTAPTVTPTWTPLACGRVDHVSANAPVLPGFTGDRDALARQVASWLGQEVTGPWTQDPDTRQGGFGAWNTTHGHLGLVALDQTGQRERSWHNGSSLARWGFTVTPTGSRPSPARGARLLAAFLRNASVPDADLPVERSGVFQGSSDASHWWLQPFAAGWNGTLDDAAATTMDTYATTIAVGPLYDLRRASASLGQGGLANVLRDAYPCLASHTDGLGIAPDVCMVGYRVVDQSLAYDLRLGSGYIQVDATTGAILSLPRHRETPEPDAHECLWSFTVAESGPPGHAIPPSSAPAARMAP